MLTLLLGTMILLVPFIISSLEKKVKPIEWLSPIVCCYALGILMGNVLVDIWDMNLARTISEVSVMLALPLLLGFPGASRLTLPLHLSLHLHHVGQGFVEQKCQIIGMGHGILLTHGGFAYPPIFKK